MLFRSWERNDNDTLDRVMADITANPHMFDKKTSMDEIAVETE